MDLNQFLIFLKVAENQSFTKAASDLGIEKSTVSSKISQLEQRLGVRLLNRTTRSVTLTEAGEGYYRYCQQIVDNALEADEFAQTFSTEPQGLLRISAPGDFGRLLFNDLLESFLHQHEKIQVDVYLTEREVDLVRERFDIALRTSGVTLKDSSLVARKILDVEMGIYTSSRYLNQHGPISSLRDLESHPFIYFLPESKSVLVLHKNGKTYSPELKRRITINDVNSCTRAVQSGLGIGILPVSSRTQDDLSTGLVRILEDYHVPGSSLYAIYPSRHWLPSKLKYFIESLVEWGKKQSALPLS